MFVAQGCADHRFEGLRLRGGSEECGLRLRRGGSARWRSIECFLADGRSDSALGRGGGKGFARDARGTNPHHSVIAGANRPIPQAYTKTRKIGAAGTE